MTDIILDDDNDITFNGDDLALFEETDKRIVAQRLEIKIRSFKGEWFRDINYGIPWFQDVLSRNGTKNLADGYIRKTILNDRDVRSIDTYSSVVEGETLKATFTATLVDGSPLPLELEI